MQQPQPARQPPPRPSTPTLTPAGAPVAPTHRVAPSRAAAPSGTLAAVEAAQRTTHQATFPAYPPAPPHVPSRSESRAQAITRVLGVLRTRVAAKAAVRPVFRAMDDDGEGGISHAEFVHAMRRWGLREPTQQLLWVAEAIDAAGEGRIKYENFSRAMASVDLEEGLMRPELKQALSVVRGEAMARAHQAEFPAARKGPSVSFPAAPSSLKGGAALLATGEAWSEWGGVPMPSCPPREEALEEDGASANSNKPGAQLRVEERAAARKRHKVQQALDSMRRQVEMHGSVAAAFRQLEATGDSKISSAELRQALKVRFNLELSDETAAGVVREFDVDGDGAISYAEFVMRLLGKSDIDAATGGATGAGGAHVVMKQADEDKVTAARVQAGAALDVSRRLRAATNLQDMKARLQAKYGNLRDAYRAIDMDSDNTLT